MYRLHQDLFCCLSTYVDLVISNLWTIFDTLHIFCSFSFYVVGSSGETYHWCCNKEWVISEFLHFLCIYWQHTVCLFISFLFFLFTLLYRSKLYSQRTIWSTTAQSKEVFMFKRCVCVFTPVTVCSSYCFFWFIQWWGGGLAATIRQSQNTQKTQSLYS